MTVHLLLFGICKDIIGNSSVTFELRDGSTAGYLMKELVINYPKLSELNSIALAVNGEYAQSDTILKISYEIALIPPVSGG